MYYTSGIVLIKLRCVEKRAQQRDRMKEAGMEAKVSEGQENAGRVAFDTKVSQVELG